ncbi:fasciclin domain-containing protein [Nocardioides sp. ChNu-153]|uniref:fasciclin domain-containing protein n=1 Tax=unclassified Nocardioides TaxID=2615069 RepID=UPI002407485C|nr:MULTISPECIES: fasciclin domain-containing protein [unclassified Nocardioides]MDF9715148.1 fasciclin domain-containing protein [Nocardioides sp. ChNu-99]MDN7121074.1 fasciclin domain-containing protein [Nocardioides sp. ChNu-153]
MKTISHRSTIRRASGIAALALTMSVGLAACSDDSSSEDGASDSSGDTSESSSPSESASSDASSDGAATESAVFGDACGQIPTDGAGSLEGMTVDPVATAASNNPLLSQLVGAVGLVPGLADQLNSAEGLTVFAPFNGAFEAVPADVMSGLTADPEGALAPVLSYHVVPERLEPDEVAGEHETLNGAMLTVEGDAEQGVTSGATGTEATVLCGGIQTANATVYVIDSVMLPPA